MENLNSREYLEKIKIQVLSNLERTRHTPSVQMTDVGKSLTEHQEERDDILDDLDEDTVGMDRRSTQRQWEKRVEREGELEDDSEDEEMADALGVRSQGVKRRRNEANFGEEGMGRGEDMEHDNATASDHGNTVFTPAGAGSENETAEKQQDPSKALGYNGEHDEELEALAKETDHEEQQQPQQKDGDGDVEMEEAAAPEKEQQNEDGDKMDAEPTPVEATSTTPAPEPAAATSTPAPAVDTPEAPAAAPAAALASTPAEGEKEPEKSS